METRGKFVLAIRPPATDLRIYDNPADESDLVVLSRHHSMAEADAWRDELQARIDTINRRHCAACE